MNATFHGTPWSAAVLGELRTALLSHYDSHRRTLPWRGESDPYRVLVSEVMLQQTRVETVTHRYASWLDRFPDVETLARAEEDDVLKAWEGLGYYRRARNLHRAARLVRERPDTSLPSTYAELRELPGFGDYTAGAVASIAFGEAVAAVDGNARRVLARLLDEASPTPAWLRRSASALLDPARPGDWNQAMMDLGATVCVPRTPRCEACPVSAWCAARAAGTQGDRPARTSKRQPRVATFALAVLYTAGRVLLERRPAGGLLGGMWAFPERHVADASEAVATAADLARERGLDVVGAAEAVALPTCAHRFTHLTATYWPAALEVARPHAERGNAVWIEIDRPSPVALPAAQRRVLASMPRYLAAPVFVAERGEA
jgi:A/G-specific adenine glycosylase